METFCFAKEIVHSNQLLLQIASSHLKIDYSIEYGIRLYVQATDLITIGLSFKQKQNAQHI